MKALPNQAWFYYTLLLSIGFLLCFKLDTLPLKLEEPRRALVTMEMIASGDFLTPTINGHVYHNKPPLYNWFLAICFSIFGYSFWVVRLPTVFSLLLIALANYTYFKSRIGKEAALLGSLFLITSVDLLFFFSFQGEIDLFYAMLVYFQVLSIFHFVDRGKPLQLFLISYGLMALGFLTKGIPSLAFQAVSLLAILIHGKKFKWLLTGTHFLGLFLASGIIGAYFYAYGQKVDVWLYLGRLLTESSRRTTETNLWPWLLHVVQFPLTLLKLTAPWCVFAFLAMYKYDFKDLKGNRWLTLFLVFILPNLLLYWLSTGTRDRYLYMFLPFVFNGLAVVILASKQQHFGTMVTWFLISMVTLAVVTFYFFPMGHEVPYHLAVTLLLIILLGSLAVLLHRKSVGYITATLILLLLTRLGFDLTVTEIRAREDFGDRLQDKAGLLAALNEPIQYYAPFEIREASIPIVNHQLRYQEIERLPYAISFHYTQQTGQILRHSDQLKDGQLYIAKKEYVLNEPIETKEEFSISKQRDYVVFRKIGL